MIENRSANSSQDFASEDAAGQLVEAVQKFSKVRSLTELIDITKRAARRITQADGASFVLRDGANCYYVDEDAIGPLWKGRRFPMEACISGWAMRQRQPAIIPDIFVDDRIPHDAYRVTFVKSLAMVPIRSMDPVGAIGIYWSETYRPTAEAVRWLQTLADSTALAIEHLQAEDERYAAVAHAKKLQSENAELRAGCEREGGRELIRMCFITKRFELDGQWVPIEVLLEAKSGSTCRMDSVPRGYPALPKRTPDRNRLRRLWLRKTSWAKHARSDLQLNPVDPSRLNRAIPRFGARRRLFPPRRFRGE